MTRIEIEGLSARWADDALSLSVRSRLIAWGAVAGLSGSLALSFFPLWLKVALGVVAALTFVVVAMDSGWRQKQSMELRYTVDEICRQTGLPTEHVRQALLDAAEGAAASMPSGRILTLESGETGFEVTITDEPILEGEVLPSEFSMDPRHRSWEPVAPGSYAAGPLQGSVSRQAIFGGAASSAVDLAA